jgi:hypothetical protein
MVHVYIPGTIVHVYDQPKFVPFIVETGGYINRRVQLFLDTLRGPGVPPRRRLPDPGPLQATVTPRRRAQGGVAGPGPYPSLHARRQCGDDSRHIIPAVDLAVEAGGVRESVPVSNHQV